MCDLRQLGYEIRLARERKGLSQHELGFKLGISRSSVGLLERGLIMYPRLHTLIAIAEILDMPPGVLYELAGVKLTDSASDQLQWYAKELDAANLRRLVAIANALLAEQIDSRQKARRPAARR